VTVPAPYSDPSPSPVLGPSPLPIAVPRPAPSLRYADPSLRRPGASYQAVTGLVAAGAAGPSRRRRSAR
jgi:hypothetical protein